jgi:hypothetical protein
MTKSEANVLETDVVIFQKKFGQNKQETISVHEPENKFADKKKPIEIGNASRFARLKKSLRKKSASIL